MYRIAKLTDNPSYDEIMECIAELEEEINQQ